MTTTATLRSRKPRVREVFGDYGVLYAQGKTEMELAQIFGISHQRVSQILHGRRK